MTVRTDARLADGRELLYYDQSPCPDRAVPEDLRAQLPRPQSTSQMRWNPLRRDYAVIAGSRQDRTYRPPDGQCPLCPSRGENFTEIPAEDYEVAIFENRFPSFSLRAAEAVPSHSDPVMSSGPAAGRCEVVCFTSDHHTAFHQLPPARVRTVIDAWADRTDALAAIESVRYVFCFENRGDAIGVTLAHPHGQIYGYPFVPPRFVNEGLAVQDHLERTGNCLQCDLIQSECADGARIVRESQHWIAYVPFAARWPYEVRLVPRRHVPDLPSLHDAERDDLAITYPEILQAFDRLFDTSVPYIAGWHQAPVRAPADPDRSGWHLAAEILTIQRSRDKLKYLAGSESGAGVWINDVIPEDAAQQLRRSLGR